MTNHYYYLILLIGLILLPKASLAQTVSADSLANSLLHLEAGEEKVDAYIQLALEIKDDNSGLMFHYLNQALELAEEIEYFRGKANALYTTGKINFGRNNYSSALSYYENALVYYRSTSDTLGLFNCFDGIGEIYKNEGNLEKALSYQLENLKHAKSLKGEMNLARVYDELGEIYLQKGDPAKALFYYEKAFSYRQKNEEDINGLISTLSNLGKVYARIGNLEQAEKTHKRTISLATEQKNVSLIAKR